MILILLMNFIGEIFMYMLRTIIQKYYRERIIRLITDLIVLSGIIILKILRHGKQAQQVFP
jgi:hypothetical protein